MAHTIKEKQKILSRVNRIKGQLEAFSKAIEGEQDCYQVMQLLASCRGALNGLMGEVVEGHNLITVLFTLNTFCEGIKLTLDSIYSC